jgi:transposase
MGVMDDANPLSADLAECHQLLLAAFQHATQLERRAVDSEQQAAELRRVLHETAASYEQLQETHQATIDELHALKRWIYGRRRERLLECEGQGHLFELNPPSTQPVASDRRRRRRELNLNKLPHYRHERDLNEADKRCSGCGRIKDRIGQDESTVLEYVPAKLEVHVYVRPKYACRHCKEGVMSAPPPVRPIARGIAGPGLIAQIIVAKFGDHLPLCIFRAVRCATGCRRRPNC